MNMSKRIETIIETLERVKQKRLPKITVVFADGSTDCQNFLEAVNTIGTREDVVDVIYDGITENNLLQAMIGPHDFSDLAEV